MFWTQFVGDLRSMRKDSISVVYDAVDDVVKPEEADGCYPFVVEMRAGNTDLKVYLSKGEADALAFQLNVQLRESDAKWLREMS